MRIFTRVLIVMSYMVIGLMLIGASGCPLMSQAGVGTMINGKVTDDNGVEQILQRVRSVDSLENVADLAGTLVFAPKASTFIE